MHDFRECWPGRAKMFPRANGASLAATPPCCHTGQAAASGPSRAFVLVLDTVAADSGLDEKQIGTFIRGQGNPTYSILLRLCDGLHVDLATLTHRAEEFYNKRCRR